MLYKRYLKQSAFLFKSIGIGAVIPIAVIYVIIPFLNYCSYAKYGISDSLYNNIISYTQLFIPFFSALWSVLALREFIEGEGNEVLYINTRKIYLIFIDYLAAFFILLIPLYAVYYSLFENMKLEFIKIMIECILFNSIIYAMMFLLNSVAIALSISIIYTIYSFFHCFLGEGINIAYINLSNANYTILLDTYVPMLIISVVIFAVAAVKSSRCFCFT